MRLKSLSVAGFRGFARAVSFDLDANAIIVSGANGSGKTSMFDAILWALAGSVARLTEHQADLVSRYSPSGEARVEVSLESTTGSALTVVRRFDGTEHLSITDGEAGQLVGSAAQAALLERLWPDASTTPEPWEALARSLTRATYLQQDEVRDFVEAEGEQERFSIVGELVGIGRVAELQRQLEASRKAWTQATNVLSGELDPTRRQRLAIQEKLERLESPEDTSTVTSALAEWSSAAGVFLPTDALPAASTWSAQAVDRVLASLQRVQIREEKLADVLERTAGRLEAPIPAAPSLQPLEAAVHAAELIAQSASESVAAAERAAADIRRRQIEERDSARALGTLAALAFEHLGDRCPVCNQTYDAAETRKRLQELMAAAGSEEGEDQASIGVKPAAAEYESAELALTQARSALRDGQQRAEARRTWEQEVTVLTREAGLDPDSVALTTVRGALAEAQGRAAAVRDIRQSGEKLALDLARMAENAQRAELEQQLVRLDAELVVGEQDVAAREMTGELVSGVINALREAGESIVGSELHRVEPLLQRIYATVDPHPSLRAVHFLTRTQRGRGRLWTTLDDREAGVSVEEPAIVLSSSQLSVLAVSTFISLNLAVESLPLQVVALDDPLQSLDTVNLLGLADLLRRVAAVRQVIVSTHDERLASLLRRKLRPVEAGQRTCVIELGAWSREGPAVKQSDVPRESIPLRLVASA